MMTIYIYSQPEQLVLSAPDHRAARQLKEKVEMPPNWKRTSKNYQEPDLCKKTYWQPVTWNQSGAGGEDFERFDHELAKTSWAPHRPQLPGKSGRRPSHQIEPTKCIAMPIFKTIDEMQCSWYTHRCWESSCQGWNQQGPALVEEWQGSICRSWNQLGDTDFSAQIFITRIPWSSLSQELQRMSASHRLVGFPLHFAYSDTEAIAEGVRGTGVHLCRFFTPVAKSLDQLHVFQGTGSWVCVGSAGRCALWSTLNSDHSFSFSRNQIDCLGGAIPGNRDVCVGLRCLSCQTKIKLFFCLLLFFTWLLQRLFLDRFPASLGKQVGQGNWLGFSLPQSMSSFHELAFNHKPVPP